MSKPIIAVAMLVLAGSVPALTATSPDRANNGAGAPPPTTASLDAKSAWFSRAVGEILDGRAAGTGARAPVVGPR